MRIVLDAMGTDDYPAPDVEGAVLAAAWLLFLIPLAAAGPGYRPTLGRYLLPVAPFILMAFLVGMQDLGRVMRRWGAPLVSGPRLAAIGAAAVLVPHALLFAGNIYVQRRPDYYAVYRGGAYQRLFSIAKWLSDHEVSTPVACNGTPAVVVPALTRLKAARMPGKIRIHRKNFRKQLRRFAQRSGTDYVVYRDRSEPWPTWHLPAGALGGNPPTKPYWRLWEYDRAENTLREIDPPPAPRWPRRVPWPED